MANEVHLKKLITLRRKRRELNRRIESEAAKAFRPGMLAYFTMGGHERAVEILNVSWERVKVMNRVTGRSYWIDVSWLLEKYESES
jgi:hypothetical protein